MKKFVAILVFFYMVISSVRGHTEETKTNMSLSFGVFTKHMKCDDGTNEDNRLLSFSYDDWYVAWFENSYYEESFFFGRRMHTKRKRHERYKDWFMQANIYYGAVYGYGDNIPVNIGGVSPFILPTVGVGYRNYSFEVGLIPTIDCGVLVGMFKVEF